MRTRKDLPPCPVCGRPPKETRRVTSNCWTGQAASIFIDCTHGIGNRAGMNQSSLEVKAFGRSGDWDGVTERMEKDVDDRWRRLCSMNTAKPNTQEPSK